jgi:hypothetical protein
LTSALDAVEWSASSTGRFITEKQAPTPIGYPAVCFRADLEAME